MATHQVTESERRLLRLIVETYYDVQHVRLETNQRIDAYAEEEALATILGEEEVRKLRQAKDHNKAYKKAVRDRKPSKKKLGEVLKAYSTLDLYAVTSPEAAQQVAFMKAYQQAVDDLEGDEKHKWVNQLAAKQETILMSQASMLVKDYPLWTEWLSKVKGIGPCLAGGILAWIDITKCPHASNLISYCGMAVRTEKYACFKCNVVLDADKVPTIQERIAQGLPHEPARCPKCGEFLRVFGNSVRPEKGKVLGYNPNAKTLCWKIGESFVKTGGGYRKLYDKFRAQIEAKIAANDGFCHKKHTGKDGKLVNGGKCYDAHVYAMSKRATVKIFLGHLYIVWRKLLDLPWSKPYTFGMLSHDEASLIDPIIDKE